MGTDIGDDYRFRVYDTRLEPRLLDGLLPDLRIGSEPAITCVLGRDFCSHMCWMMWDCPTCVAGVVLGVTLGTCL